MDTPIKFEIQIIEKQAEYFILEVFFIQTESCSQNTAFKSV